MLGLMVKCGIIFRRLNCSIVIIREKIKEKAVFLYEMVSLR